jgi:hypothetical protein
MLKGKREWFIAINDDGDEVFVGGRKATEDEIKSWVETYSTEPEEQKEYFEENIKVYIGTEITTEISFTPSISILR